MENTIKPNKHRYSPLYCSPLLSGPHLQFIDHLSFPCLVRLDSLRLSAKLVHRPSDIFRLPQLESGGSHMSHGSADECFTGCSKMTHSVGAVVQELRDVVRNLRSELDMAFRNVEDRLESIGKQAPGEKGTECFEAHYC